MLLQLHIWDDERWGLHRTLRYTVINLNNNLLNMTVSAGPSLTPCHPASHCYFYTKSVTTVVENKPILVSDSLDATAFTTRLGLVFLYLPPVMDKWNNHLFSVLVVSVVKLHIQLVLSNILIHGVVFVSTWWMNVANNKFIQIWSKIWTKMNVYSLIFSLRLFVCTFYQRSSTYFWTWSLSFYTDVSTGIVLCPFAFTYFIQCAFYVVVTTVWFNWTIKRSVKQQWYAHSFGDVTEHE